MPSAPRDTGNNDSMRGRTLLLVLALACGLTAQIPMEALAPHHRVEVQDILDRLDFQFQIRTQPQQVRLATVDKLYDRPRLAAAMWRSCAFVPTLYAVELPDHAFWVSDGRGLSGTMTLIHQRPGFRVYVADGHVARGRMGNPVGVGAKMVTVYRYWEGPRGFETHLQTWTALDSALLGFLSRPFRNYIQRRQEEFIGYIFHNIAQGGKFATLDPESFREPVRREGDPVAIRQFEEAFGRNGRR